MNENKIEVMEIKKRETSELEKKIKLKKSGNIIPPNEPDKVLPGLILGASFIPPKVFPTKKEETSVVIE